MSVPPPTFTEALDAADATRQRRNPGPDISLVDLLIMQASRDETITTADLIETITAISPATPTQARSIANRVMTRMAAGRARVAQTNKIIADALAASPWGTTPATDSKDTTP